MECEKFLVEYGLYDNLKIEYDDFTDLINLLSGKQKIDLYCPKCKEKRTFVAMNNRITMPEKEPLIKMNFFAEYGDTEEDKALRDCIIAQNEWEKMERFQKFLCYNNLVTLNYVCGRDETHRQTYVLFIEGNCIKKIGQYPSYADIDIPQAEIYKKELGKGYYNEFKRAIGLYSSNVGIGSYVYLRRIIEKMIMDGLQIAIAEGL